MEKDVRFMQLMVFFDLPTKTKKNRRNATCFRNFLLKDGYQMLQFSVYCRICKGRNAVETHLLRLKKTLPPEGNIRVLQITDRQFGNMALLVGKRKKFEEFSRELIPII